MLTRRSPSWMGSTRWLAESSRVSTSSLRPISKRFSSNFIENVISMPVGIHGHQRRCAALRGLENLNLLCTYVTYIRHISSNKKMWKCSLKAIYFLIYFKKSFKKSFDLWRTWWKLDVCWNLRQVVISDCGELESEAQRHRKRKNFEALKLFRSSSFLRRHYLMAGRRGSLDPRRSIATSHSNS